MIDRVDHSWTVVGHDSRKTIQDGYPIENVVASDLRRGKLV